MRGEGRDVVGVDSEALLFVDVGVAHRDDDGVHADVHHDDVEELETDSQGWDADDVETAGSDGDGLEKPVEDSVARFDYLGGGVADVEEFKGGPVDGVECYDHEE